jgi:hypothetical protein
MPKTEEILNGLQTIVDNQSVIAIIWHIAFYFFIICLFVNWHPTNKIMGILICLPLISVAVLAWTYHNPFNGALFTILAILIFVFALKTTGIRVSFSTWPFIAIGIILLFNPLGSPVISLSFIVFGLFYGLFGVFKLSVTLDLFLLFGSISLSVKHFLFNRAL